MDSESFGRGRTVVGPVTQSDDGSADPVLRALLDGGCGSEDEMLRVLADSRLLVAVLAVADEVDADGADKSSHMAVVSMVNSAGEKGLLAFTGLDSMAAWNPDARPVPVPARAAAEAALADGAQALVIDVSGPARVVLPAEVLPTLIGDASMADELAGGELKGGE